jgi:DNA polymerase iota
MDSLRKISGKIFTDQTLNSKFLKNFSWNGKVEKLGFDEVFLDVSDVIDYNFALLNKFDLKNSFFQLRRDDPTVGFEFDANNVAGHVYPEESVLTSAALNSADLELHTRLILGSHMAQHLRLRMEHEMGFTSAVGISTNKLLSKLAGNLHKPKGQTTLLPPYTIVEGANEETHDLDGNATKFMDSHDIGKIPGIGFKLAQSIRNHVRLRPIGFNVDLPWSERSESVTVKEVRLFPGMSPETLEKILGGPGAERGIGGKVWALITGSDDTEVQQFKKVPTQISIEDSYIRLDTFAQVQKELSLLAASLLNRMQAD